MGGGGVEFVGEAGEGPVDAGTVVGIEGHGDRVGGVGDGAAVVHEAAHDRPVFVGVLQVKRGAAQADQAPLTPASLRTDLALARAEISRLRAEHDKLRHRLRLQLGAEIDGPDRAELITRVADLESLTRQLLTERDTRTTEADLALRCASGNSKTT